MKACIWTPWFSILSLARSAVVDLGISGITVMEIEMATDEVADSACQYLFVCYPDSLITFVSFVSLFI